MKTIAFELRADVAEDFSGGTVNIGDGKMFDLAEGLDEGGGKIVLSVTPSAIEMEYDENTPMDEREELRAEQQKRQEEENFRAEEQRKVADALDGHPALKRAAVGDDEPVSAPSGDMTLTPDESDESDEPTRGSGPDDSGGAPNATPRAVEKAAELNVDLSGVVGSGADGQITVDDVRSAASNGEDD